MTPQLSLSDQIAITGVVDDIRSREMKVAQILNASKNELAVAEKIRSYYIANGIEVDDQIIQQAISKYYSDRYRIKQSKIGTLKRCVFNAWQYKSNVFVAACLLALFTTGYQVIYEHQEELDKRQMVAQVTDAKVGLINKAKGQMEQLDKLLIESDSHLKLLQKLSESDKEKYLVIEGLITGNSKEARQDWGTFEAALHGYESDLDSFGDDKVAYVRDISSKLGSRIDQTKLYLEMVDNARELFKMEGYYAYLKTNIDAMHLSLEDQVVFDDVIKPAIAGLKDLKPSAMIASQEFAARMSSARSVSRKLETMVSYARDSISIEVKNDGSQSGFENNGKYYALVEPVKGNGDTAVIVDDFDNSNANANSKIGISITSDFYKSLKEDKSSDGDVDDNSICFKKPNTLKLSCRPEVNLPLDMVKYKPYEYYQVNKLSPMESLLINALAGYVR